MNKKLTTTKLVLFATLIFCAILELAIVIAWIAGDKCDAAGLAGVVAAPASVVIGFYEWKAKAENLSKYGCKIDESQQNNAQTDEE